MMDFILFISGVLIGFAVGICFAAWRIKKGE